jgi:NAD(P)H-flavin reductase
LVFLIALRGKGTWELASMQIGEEAEIIGPLGKAWSDVLPPHTSSGKAIALVGGGIGVAPLNALLHEVSAQPETKYSFNMYAGFKTGFTSDEEQSMLLGSAHRNAAKLIIASEDGTTGQKGRIGDFFEPERYAAVCTCGPEAMMQAVAEKCKAAGVPCYVSLERRMACGVGACRGCTVQTINGNRRCCADGPVFNAAELTEF